MNIDGCVAVVTGGNGGLGRVIAETLASEGAHVALVCQSSIDETRNLSEQLTAGPGAGSAAAFAADIGEPASVERLRDDVLETFGNIDVLVNNAAYNQWIPFADLDTLTPELWHNILRTNSTGPFLSARAFARSLGSGNGGRIVNISSIAGFDAQGSSIAYAVSKAALNHLTRCLSVALAPDVLVNGVAPGYMEGTRMSSRLPAERVAASIQDSLLRRPTLRQDVADQVVSFVRSDSTTGQTVCVDAGRHLH